MYRAGNRAANHAGGPLKRSTLRRECEQLQKLRESIALLRRELVVQVKFGFADIALCRCKKCLARCRRYDVVSASVGGVGLAPDEAAVLKVIHESYDLAGIEAEERRQIPLRGTCVSRGKREHGV